MKNKNFFIMTAVFIVLVIFYFFTSYKPREVKPGAVPLFAGKKPTIDMLEIITSEGENIVIEKKNAVWTITSPFEYKANSTVVEQAINELTDISIDGVVSDREESRDKYDTGDKGGISLKASSAGKTVLDVVIGRINDDFTHTFARLSDSDEINLWRGTVAVTFNKSPDEWRDKNILSLHASDIKSIKSMGDGYVQELEYNTPLWIYTESDEEKPVDQVKVKNFVDLFASLNCDSFADENEISFTEENEPDGVVTIMLNSGRVMSYDIWEGVEDKNRYLLKLSDSDIVFGLNKYRGVQILIDYETIKPENDENA